MGGGAGAEATSRHDSWAKATTGGKGIFGIIKNRGAILEKMETGASREKKEKERFFKIKLPYTMVKNTY